MKNDLAAHSSTRRMSGLEDSTLDDVLRGQKRDVVTLQHNFNVEEAMKVLADSGILSAPVIIAPDLEDLGELSVETPRTQLIGWVDTNDLLREFLKIVGHKVTPQQKMLHTMSVIEQHGPEFAEKKLITFLGGRDRSLVYQSDSSMPLKDALRKYFLQEGGAGPVHRIALFDQTGEIQSIVSQMDVMQYLVKHCKHADWARMSIKDAGLVSADRPVCGVDINAPTLRALQQMQEQGHSAAAVLSPDGKLVTNLSSSDLRFLQPDHLSVLALPLGEFLALLHGAVYLGYSSTASASAAHKFFARHREKRPVPLVTCTADASLLHAMHQMVEKHVHRVYVVDDEATAQPTPQAVVTPTDILTILVRA